MKITIIKSLSKDFKLSKNFNSIGGNVGYSISAEIDVKDLKDVAIENTKNKLDSIVNQWVSDEATDQINIAHNEMK